MALIDYQIQEVRRDLSAFADPLEEVVISRTTTGFSAVWIQNREIREALFITKKGDELPEVEFERKRYTYSGFLASEKMADLRDFANMTLNVLSLKKDYVDSRATIGLNDESKEGNMLDLLKELTMVDESSLLTKIIFLKGEAGAGKTYNLEHLTRIQSLEYLNGKTKKLFLYVNAQGRALSRLNEAISTELDDLRARFTYHPVIPLCRRNCLVLIIDGFDELIGSGGYDEAFASLGSFLGELGGSGTIIASARSAFYEHRNFRGVVKRYYGGEEPRCEIVPIEIKPWRRTESIAYLTQVEKTDKRWSEKIKKSPEEFYDSIAADVSDRNNILLTKPFYLSKLVELILDGEDFNPREDYLSQIVEHYIERELDKFLDGQGKLLLDIDGHLKLLCELAMEMWWQEVRFLDVHTIQTVAEIVAEELKIDPSRSKYLIEKVPSYALLGAQDTSSPPKRGFQHESLFSYYLSLGVIELINHQEESISVFFNRSSFPEPLIDEISSNDYFSGADSKERILEVIAKICNNIKPRATEALARQNAGNLAFKLLSHFKGADGLPSNIEFRSLIVEEASLSYLKMERPRFIDCHLDRIDISNAIIIHPFFESTALSALTIDPASTKLEGAIFKYNHDLFSIAVWEDFGRKEIYEPNIIDEYLRKIGAELTGYEKRKELDIEPIDIEIVNLFERLLRHLERNYYARIHDTFQRRLFFDHPKWEALEEILQKNDLIEYPTKQISGHRQDLVRLSYPPDLIRRGQDEKAQNTPENIKKFWKELYSFNR